MHCTRYATQRALGGYDGDIVNAIDDVLDAHNVLPSQAGGLSDTKLLEILDDIEGEALGILVNWSPSKLN